MSNDFLGHIHVVDDNHELRLWLARSLQRVGYQVHTYESAEQFLRNAVFQSPAVLLLDMRLPLNSGLELQRLVGEHHPHLPVIFISGQSRNDEIISAFRGGAMEFLWKPFSVEDLLASLEKALLQSRAHAIRLSRKQESQELLARLSPRERQVLPLLLNAYTNKEIAELLHIQPDTAKKHKVSILEKCELSSISELIRFFSGVDVGFR